MRPTGLPLPGRRGCSRGPRGAGGGRGFVSCCLSRFAEPAERPPGSKPWRPAQPQPGHEEGHDGQACPGGGPHPTGRVGGAAPFSKDDRDHAGGGLVRPSWVSSLALSWSWLLPARGGWTSAPWLRPFPLLPRPARSSPDAAAWTGRGRGQCLGLCASPARASVPSGRGAAGPPVPVSPGAGRGSLVWGLLTPALVRGLPHRPVWPLAAVPGLCRARRSQGELAPGTEALSPGHVPGSELEAHLCLSAAGPRRGAGGMRRGFSGVWGRRGLSDLLGSLS